MKNKIYILIIFLILAFKCNNSESNNSLKRWSLYETWKDDSLYLLIRDKEKAIMTNYRMFFYRNIREEVIPSYTDSNSCFDPDINGVIKLQEKYLSSHFNAQNDTIDVCVITFDGKTELFKLRIKK